MYFYGLSKIPNSSVPTHHTLLDEGSVSISSVFLHVDSKQASVPSGLVLSWSPNTNSSFLCPHVRPFSVLWLEGSTSCLPSPRGLNEPQIFRETLSRFSAGFLLYSFDIFTCCLDCCIRWFITDFPFKSDLNLYENRTYASQFGFPSPPPFHTPSAKHSRCLHFTLLLLYSKINVCAILSVLSYRAGIMDSKEMGEN